MLFEQYRRIDAGLAATGPSSVGVRTARFVTEELGEWLTINDNVLLEGHSTMLNPAFRKADRLRQLLDELARTQLVLGFEDDVARLRSGIDGVEDLVAQSRRYHGEDRLERLRELAGQQRPIAEQLVMRSTRLRDQLQQRAEFNRAELEGQQDSFSVLAWLAALVYFGVIWLCWLWIAHRVVSPIEKLSEAAGRANHEEQDFELPKAGPAEVRELTDNISSFVNKLQAAKAGTEQQVRERTTELVRANPGQGPVLGHDVARAADAAQRHHQHERADPRDTGSIPSRPALPIRPRAPRRRCSR